MIGFARALADELRDHYRRAQLERTSNREWSKAESLADLGALTARWLAGEISHPNGHDTPDAETREIADALAHANLNGYVTTCSQPGCDDPFDDGGHWEQRAAVDGFADEPTARHLEAIAREHGLQFITGLPRRWRRDYTQAVTVTQLRSPDGQVQHYTGFGVIPSRGDLDGEFSPCGDGACDAIRAAHHVTLIDPEWNRNDRLRTALFALNARRTP